ncbi:AAA family ATPase [Porticoccaceae bacterium]|nr:AAA family ATPase [Porticoccaceae bacterium]MDB4559187.1 AAA family ATPase [bacterium]
MLEQTILSGLLHNEDYMRRVVPFLSDDYFDDFSEKSVYKSIVSYISDYNGVPTKEALRISIEEKSNISDDQYQSISQIITALDYDEKTDIEWLVDKTEKFCQDKAIYNAVRESILVLDGQHKDLDKGSIPELLSNALGVSFDQAIGHDFLEQPEDRFDFYHTKEDKIGFDLDLFNKITKGGLSRKSLSIALAGTGVGKTLFMTHCASANLMAGKNVLYITMEMAEEKISERIDANLMNTTMDSLQDMPKDVFMKRVQKVKDKTTGKLIVKEFPTASAGSAHFRHLLNELKLKKNFTPDMVYIDYLNICTSSRMKAGANVNSYTIIKAIAEELRGLAVEFNVPILSATQTTRTGYSSSDLNLEDTSESFGLPATADFMFGLISTEELEGLGQLMVKQLKNRWGDTNYLKRFIIGIDRSKMKLFDAEDSAQDLVNDGQSNQKTDSKPSWGNKDSGDKDNVTSFRNKKKPDFGGFK